jgi:REP element-mobilizing transposase RayT
LHVTLRLVEGVPSLRRVKAGRYVRRCIQLGHKNNFRVVQFSVMGNHLHLIVEADDRRALSKGMQGLKIRLARRLNALFQRRGELFKERYHARALRSPREVRWALGYVLNNRRKHARQGGATLAKGWVDPFSSAPFFQGWSRRPWTDPVRGMDEDVCALAEGWLLRGGWKRGGASLDPDLVPGPAP